MPCEFDDPLNLHGQAAVVECLRKEDHDQSLAGSLTKTVGKELYKSLPERWWHGMSGIDILPHLRALLPIQRWAGGTNRHISRISLALRVHPCCMVPAIVALARSLVTAARADGIPYHCERIRSPPSFPDNNPPPPASVLFGRIKSEAELKHFPCTQRAKFPQKRAKVDTSTKRPGPSNDAGTRPSAQPTGSSGGEATSGEAGTLNLKADAMERAGDNEALEVRTVALQ